jgi:hypothetical protein
MTGGWGAELTTTIENNKVIIYVFEHAYLGTVGDQADYFSRLYMIWLLAHPLPPLPSVQGRPVTHRKTEVERQLAHGREEGIIRLQESLVLYKAFNTRRYHVTDAQYARNLSLT